MTSLFNKRQRKRDKMRRGKLDFNEWLVRLFCPSSGLEYQNKLAGEIPNIFLLTVISKRNIFCGKNKRNEVVYNNINDMFVSSNLTCKLKSFLAEHALFWVFVHLNNVIV